MNEEQKTGKDPGKEQKTDKDQNKDREINKEFKEKSRKLTQDFKNYVIFGTKSPGLWKFILPKSFSGVRKFWGFFSWIGLILI